MTTYDRSVSVKIIAEDGTTVVKELNDPDNGLSAVLIANAGDEAVRKVRTNAPLVEGDALIAEVDDASDITVVVSVEGASWAAVSALWQTVRTAYRSASFYYLEATIEGVTTRWRTERPDEVRSEQVDDVSLTTRVQTYSIRWHVQPSPSVSIA